MTKAVLTTKIEPTYDDLPEKRYHFPRTYLRQVEAAIGDWIVYYEPRRGTGDLMSRGGRQSYFATANVTGIEADAQLPDHFYARIAGFLPFTRPVPFRDAGHYYESGLTKFDGTTNKGAFGRAVRLLQDIEYEQILAAGFAFPLGLSPRFRDRPDAPDDVLHGVGEFGEDAQAEYVPDTVDRAMVETLLSRPFRDRAFSAAIKTAYHDRCAITGLKLINGGGRSEVEAAHIRPVAAHGPDSVRNGLALSGTVHWMFDRGLLSVDDNSRLLVSARAPAAQFRGLIEPGRPLLLPDRIEERPHPQFLDYHRKSVFKA